MQYCVIILDGASGWPVAELGGKTTLQAAATPHLDELAAARRLEVVERRVTGSDFFLRARLQA